MTYRETILFFGLGSAIALYLYSLTDSGKAFVSDATTKLSGLFVNRGLADNNPGNIRRTSDQWVGLLTRQQVEANGGKWDSAFCQFDTVEHGVRAFGHVLTTYANLGINTVADTVGRYAPPSDGNDTAGYTAEVADTLGVAPGQVIDLYGSLPQLAAAMMKRETGYVGNPADIESWVYE